MFQYTIDSARVVLNCGGQRIEAMRPDVRFLDRKDGPPLVQVTDIFGRTFEENPEEYDDADQGVWEKFLSDSGYQMEVKTVTENNKSAFDFELTPQGWLLCWRGNPDQAIRVTAVRLATSKGERRVQFLERKGSWRSIPLDEGREMLLALGWDGESPGFKWGVQEAPAAPKKDAARNEGSASATAAKPFRIPQGVTLVHFVILGEGGRRLASGNSMGVKDVDAMVEEFRKKAREMGGRLHAYWTGQEAREI